ncbi:MAG TPA: DUF6298 domain-containing protein [Planctomycetota bacterium]|nr:DUF6298 domain-containing protein [Planctomycetota bacterium]
MRNEDRIQPWAKNPRYWQLKGQPVLPIGGTKDDSLFQIPDIEEHLDLLKSVGGNVIRNTMSDRPDFGFEVYPFKRLADGKYDLEQWNDEYWRRFETMLRLTAERGIVVQIEVWDRFDYARDNWAAHPYNPDNNVSYTAEQTGLASRYPDHPGSDKQPFFHTIPGMRRYQKRYDVIRRCQERFVAKLLSYSLDRGNVLYCMDNETSSPVEWGQHWMAFIRKQAEAKGVAVCVTDMFDDAWKPETCDKLKHATEHPETYTFLDVSQVNSRNFGQAHWDRFQWIVKQIAKAPRPLNHTKIYSAGQTTWGSGTPKDGVERFWRNLLGGAASSRFHRPTAGIGLNEVAQACLRAARKVESLVKFWDVVPHMELLADREANEAYLAAKPGTSYVLFFTDGGSVALDLTGHAATFRGKWVDIRTGEWGAEVEWQGGQRLTVQPPGKGPWVAVVTGAVPRTPGP